MGVFKKVDKKGQMLYGIDFYAYGRRYRKLVGPKRALAEAVLAKARVEIAEDKFLDKRKVVKVRFVDFADKFYAEYCVPNHRTPERTAGAQLKVLKQYFGEHDLDEIKQLDVENFKSYRRQQVSPASVNRALACLRCLYNRAIEWGFFHGTNPVRNVKQFREDNHRERYLCREEIDRLLVHCKGNVGNIIVVVLNSGMRRGEIFNLKWADIDFEREQIHVLQTKNGKKRIVPMNDFLKHRLVGLYKERHQASPYVFSKVDGGKYNCHRTPFQNILKKAGINNFRFHDLRHTFASHLVMSGVDLLTVKEILGHYDVRLTTRYAHLSQDHKKQAVNVLNQKMDIIWTTEVKREKYARSLEVERV